MTIKKIYILFLFHLAFTLGVFSQQLVVKSPVRFLALGDSYTIGQGVYELYRWPNQFVEALYNKGIETEKLKIIAQTGWRTDNLLNAISIENTESNYNLVSLLIGVNNQFQGKNIDVYAVEFRKLLETALALCGGRQEGVFVLSIPDYGYTPFGLFNQAMISAEIDQYNKINRDIALEMGITYFDITGISREVISTPRYLAPDNLHPSGDMYSKWVELIINNSVLTINTSNIFEYQSSNSPEAYPNPARKSITINTPPEGNAIIIFNSQGAIVWQSDIAPLEKFNINVSGWNDGLYFYQIKQNNKAVLSGKFLVKIDV